MSSTPIVSRGPGQITTEQLVALRRTAPRERPTFAHRLELPLMVEELRNPWFKASRILSVQSPVPMPAMGTVVAVTPAGEARFLSGQPATLNELIRGEALALADDDAARAYANTMTFWTRGSDWPELPVASFEDIPFRRNLSDTERATVEKLRTEVRMAAPAFTRHGAGWRLDVWLASSSRLLHRVADIAADGVIDVRDEIVAPSIPVPPGRAWGTVGGRMVPIG